MAEIPKNEVIKMLEYLVDLRNKYLDDKSSEEEESDYDIIKSLPSHLARYLTKPKKVHFKL